MGAFSVGGILVPTRGCTPEQLETLFDLAVTLPIFKRTEFASRIEEERYRLWGIIPMKRKKQTPYRKVVDIAECRDELRTRFSEQGELLQIGSLVDPIPEMFHTKKALAENDLVWTPDTLSIHYDQCLSLEDLDNDTAAEVEGVTIALSGNGYFFPHEPPAVLRSLGAINGMEQALENIARLDLPWYDLGAVEPRSAIRYCTTYRMNASGPVLFATQSL